MGAGSTAPAVRRSCSASRSRVAVRCGACGRLGAALRRRLPGGRDCCSGCSAAPACCAAAPPAGRSCRARCAGCSACVAAVDRLARARQRQVVGINFILSVFVPGVGRRHRRLFRRRGLRQAQAGAGDQPRQELGRRAGAAWLGALVLARLALLDGRVAVDSAASTPRCTSASAGRRWRWCVVCPGRR